MTIGIFAGEQLLHHWRIRTNQERTTDELGLLLKSFLANENLHSIKIEGAIVSSVVPSLMRSVIRVCETYFQITPLLVGPGIRTGLAIKYDNHREVGADRIVSAISAIVYYGFPVIIVDFGTATTFSVVDEQGSYVGGVIAPGLMTSLNALCERAAKLPQIDLVKPKNVIGRSTISSMQSGLIYGFAGLVDGIVARIQNELSLPFFIVATGGLAEWVCTEAQSIHKVDPFLTLQGLRLLWNRNQSS